MEFLRIVTEEEVLGTLLQIEYRTRDLKSQTAPSLHPIIERPNFESPAENAARAHVLWTFRAVLLRYLPPPDRVVWWAARLGEDEFRRLFVIREKDWEVFSARTFRLSVTAERFHGQEAGDPTRRQGIQALVQAARSDALDTRLILYAGTKDGPFTILDGNHRATALYIAHFLEERGHPFRPLTVFVGLSPLRITWQAA